MYSLLLLLSLLLRICGLLVIKHLLQLGHRITCVIGTVLEYLSLLPLVAKYTPIILVSPLPHT